MHAAVQSRLVTTENCLWQSSARPLTATTAISATTTTTAILVRIESFRRDSILPVQQGEPSLLSSCPVFGNGRLSSNNKVREVAVDRFSLLQYGKLLRVVLFCAGVFWMEAEK